MKLRTRKQEQSKEYEKAVGYTITEPFGDFDTGRGTICLWKGFLMFGAALGTILSIVSAFELQVNLLLIVVAFFVFSMLLSFLHYHHVLFNIGYPIAFFVFAFSIFQNRRYVNSGYQAIVNQVKSDYREYFRLNYTGEAYEAVDNRYLAMTYAFLYLGFFLIVLLNIAISNYMSICLTMLFTFPFLQFGLYIEKMPSLISVFLLLFVYASVLFFKRSGHYALSERRKKDQAFVVKKNVFSYKGQGKVMGQLLGITFGWTLLFSLAAYPLMRLVLPGSEKTSALKAATDSTIETLVQSGFSSLFNRYDATGGISGGRLGGVNRIKADYETDLEVTFVPSSLESMYLKAYTGAEYTGNQWLAPNYEEGWVKKKGYHESYENFTARLEAKRLARFSEEKDSGVQYGKMTVKNVGAESGYLYLPYYEAGETGALPQVSYSVLVGASPVGQTYSLNYYPYTQDLSELQKGADSLLESEKTGANERKYIETYEELCKEAYTQIPENIYPKLSGLAAEIGEGQTAQETVERICSYLEENYSYSLNPGATPQNQDFVTWFLEHQKKGFCTHFATAGTLLCRAYGIPARYVEGYVIQTTDYAEAAPKEGEAVEDWFTGSNELEKSGVVTVMVPDANAHAWTEIYLEGFGWVPVDFTPPSEDIDAADEYNSFLQIFAGLFSVQQGETTEVTDGSQEAVDNPAGSVFKDHSFVLMPLAVLVFVLFLLFLGRGGYVRLKPRFLRMRAYRSGRYDDVLSYDYRRLVHTLQKSHKDIQIPALPGDVLKLAASLEGKPVDADVSKVCRLLERGLYGKGQMEKNEADAVIRFVAEFIKNIKKI